MVEGQAHLKGQDRPGHRTRREQHAQRQGTAKRQQTAIHITGVLAAPFHKQHQTGHAYPETGENDVPAQEDAHLRSRRDEAARSYQRHTGMISQGVTARINGIG